MQEARTVAVNIVAWNSQAYLPNLFASLDSQDVQDFTVTVIDNASNDGTLQWLQGERPETVVLRNFRNQGFARAHNQAIELMLSRWPEEAWRHRYILVTNPDLELSPSCLSRLVSAMETDMELAAVGPKLLRAFVTAIGDDGNRETERTNMIDSTGLVIKKSRRTFDRGAGEEDKGKYDAATEVFGISGACVLFRASSLAAAKLSGEYFDEDMYAYKEDIDLAWRMRRLGMRARYVPEAVAWHHRRAPSTEQGFLWLSAFVRRFRKPGHINFYSTRNHVWLVWKNDEIPNRLMHMTWIVPYEFGKFIASFVSPSSFKGELSALAGFSKMWKKRQELKRRAKVSGKAMRKWFV